MKDQQLRKELTKALQWEDTHVSFGRATAGIDQKIVGHTSPQLSYSIWQLAEHIRITQHDIIVFSMGEGYSPLRWPEDYWPESPAPSSPQLWEETLKAVHEDRQRMVALLNNAERDLFVPFPHGSGQHLFREALLVIDHEAYHTGQIVLIRKMLNSW